MGLSNGSPPAGGQLTLSGQGFPPETVLTATLFSTPVVLGSVTSDAQGSFQMTVTIPLSTPPGQHEIVVSGGGVQSTTPLVVLAAVASSSPNGNLPVTGTNASIVFWAIALIVFGSLAVQLGASNRHSAER